ncbi:hypothetical protein NEOLEDRAFT_1125841, partial [Neolentinus lepideus HHB14362 ss-1]
MFMQNGLGGAIVRPWVWILLLFLGPVISSVAIYCYIFINTGTLVRTEGIITQLVFEHALRVRMKAETASEEGKSTDNTAASSLVGKINNLVTTDLGNLCDGRDFLVVVLYGPLQVILCMAFLYVLLGWSSFVGLVVMIALAPVPGYIAKLLQTVQAERMKKTDVRVETVTETMNVLRMIKLFGWEGKMSERLSDKREEELTWLWKRQILGLLNGNINYIIPVAHMIATFVTY